MILFDGETKSYLGKTFGYHVTGGFYLSDDQGIRVEPKAEGKYFDIIFNTTGYEYIFSYDETRGFYSLKSR